MISEMSVYHGGMHVGMQSISYHASKEKAGSKLGRVAHACNLSILGDEAGGLMKVRGHFKLYSDYQTD